MLRITVHDTTKQVTLKLEGSLTGSWVMELEDCWRAASSNLARRVLCLDLTAVDNVDTAREISTGCGGQLALGLRLGCHVPPVKRVNVIRDRNCDK